MILQSRDFVKKLLVEGEKKKKVRNLPGIGGTIRFFRHRRRKNCNRGKREKLKRVWMMYENLLKFDGEIKFVLCVRV